MAQEVYCLDRATGVLKRSFQPFAKPGISSLHTLGAIESKGLLFSIADSPDGGGVVAMELTTGQKRWFAELPNISESFVIAPGNDRLYIASRPEGTLRYELNAIDLSTGAVSVIHRIFGGGTPKPSLGALGDDGTLYFPYPGGFIRYRD